jgi:hypothetical protein
MDLEYGATTTPQMKSLNSRKPAKSFVPDIIGIARIPITIMHQIKTQQNKFMKGDNLRTGTYYSACLLNGLKLGAVPFLYLIRPENDRVLVLIQLSGVPTDYCYTY